MPPAMAWINVRVLHNLAHEGVDLIPSRLHRIADAKLIGLGINEQIPLLGLLAELRKAIR
jgi:hypothetical protein